MSERTGAGPAAPGALETVRQFVNTRDVEEQSDAIATPEMLSAWLNDHGLLPAGAQATGGDLRRARLLRETLRDCLLANHERLPAPAGAREVLNELAARSGLLLQLAGDGRWRPEPPTDRAADGCGALLAIVATASIDGQWDRLKVCLNDTCRWAFYDHSRARTGRWCSMQVCGNRAKQLAWRTRQTQQGAREAVEQGADGSGTGHDGG